MCAPDVFISPQAPDGFALRLSGLPSRGRLRYVPVALLDLVAAASEAPGLACLEA
jgi:hypothetical protein